MCLNPTYNLWHVRLCKNIAHVAGFGMFHLVSPSYEQGEVGTNKVKQRHAKDARVRTSYKHTAFPWVS